MVAIRGSFRARRLVRLCPVLGLDEREPDTTPAQAYNTAGLALTLLGKIGLGAGGAWTTGIEIK